MSENEANWWLLRSKRVPFLTEQVNMSGSHYTNWLKHDYMNDEKALKEAHERAQKQLAKNKEKDNAPR